MMCKSVETLNEGGLELSIIAADVHITYDLIDFDNPIITVLTLSCLTWSLVMMSIHSISEH